MQLRESWKIKILETVWRPLQRFKDKHSPWLLLQYSFHFEKIFLRTNNRSPQIFKSHINHGTTNHEPIISSLYT